MFGSSCNLERGLRVEVAVRGRAIFSPLVSVDSSVAKKNHDAGYITVLNGPMQSGVPSLIVMVDIDVRMR